MRRNSSSDFTSCWETGFDLFLSRSHRHVNGCVRWFFIFYFQELTYLASHCRWSLIAGRLPGRTDNEIKNYWNTNLSKRVRDHKSPASTGKPNSKKNEIKPTSTTASEWQLVRTRAIRCTKVFINPEQPLPGKAEPISDVNIRESSGASINGTVRSNTSTDELSTSFPGKDNNPLDFMLDFNVEEFCLADLLNSDSSDFGNLSYSIRNDNSNDLSPSSEQPVIFRDEMFQDWANGDGVQTNEGLSLHSFSPFPEYGGALLENNWANTVCRNNDKIRLSWKNYKL